MGIIERSTRLPVMYGIVVCTVTIGTLFVSSSIDQSTRNSKQYESYNSAAQRAARKLMEKHIISDKAINVLEKFPLHKEYYYDDSYSSLQYDINRMENFLPFFPSSESYDYPDFIADSNQNPGDNAESLKPHVDNTDKQLNNQLPHKQSTEFEQEKPFVGNQPVAEQSQKTNRQPEMAPKQPTNKLEPPSKLQPQSSTKQQLPVSGGEAKEKLQILTNQQVSGKQDISAKLQQPVDQQQTVNNEPAVQQKPIQNQPLLSNETPPKEENPSPNEKQQPSNSQLGVSQQLNEKKTSAREQQSPAQQQPPARASNQKLTATVAKQAPVSTLEFQPSNQQSAAKQQPSDDQKPPTNQQPPIMTQLHAEQKKDPAQQNPNSPVNPELSANQQHSSNKQPLKIQKLPSSQQIFVEQQTSVNKPYPENERAPSKNQPVANQQIAVNQEPPTNQQSPENQKQTLNDQQHSLAEDKQQSSNQQPPSNPLPALNQQPPPNQQPVANNEPSPNQGPPVQQQPRAKQQPSRNQAPPANPQPPSNQQPTFNKKPDANQENLATNQKSPSIKHPPTNQQQSSENQKSIANNQEPPNQPSLSKGQISDKALAANPQPPTNEQVKRAVVQNVSKASSNVNGYQNEFCKSVKLMPKGTMPLVALLSSPGSGNTWTRFLIEHATGIYTGSVYDDFALYKGGFLGELEDVNSGTTVVTKTHFFPRSQKYQYSKVVLLVRNPYNCILSEFNRQNAPTGKNQSHVSYADPSLFQTSNWTQYAKGAADRWFLIMEAALKAVKPSNVLFVYYESLLVDVAGPLEKIERFLGLPVEKSRLECTKRISDKSGFHRPHKSLGFDPYSEELTNRIQSNIEKARQLILQNYNTTLPKYEKETVK